MNISDCLKKHFPNHTVLNYSRKSVQEVTEGVNKCHSDDKFLLYLFPREINIPIFNHFMMETKCRIQMLVFNKDDYYYLDWDVKNNVESSVRFIKNSINKDKECCICYSEHILNNGVCCITCSGWMCTDCTFKTHLFSNDSIVRCPLCRQTNFYPSKEVQIN